MRKLDLTDYTFPGRNERGEITEFPYLVRDSVIAVLFHPELKLTARQALDRDDIARKVRDCPEPFILLEDAEYALVRNSVETVKGFVQADVRFIRRVLDAPEVRVTVAP
jgi:hypothetical protein